MFQLSVLFLVGAVGAVIPGFFIIEGAWVDMAQTIFLVAMFLFSITGLVGLFWAPWADITQPSILPAGQKTMPD